MNHPYQVAQHLHQNTQNLYYAAYNAAVIAGAPKAVLDAIDQATAPMLAKAEATFSEQRGHLSAESLAAPYTPATPNA